jgi:uncharacterized repeat protein (TIGR01451 family)
MLSRPTGVAADTAGNLYIADAGTYFVYKVNSSGIINVAAGNGTLYSPGDGGQATSASVCPQGNLAADAAGNLYIPDSLTSSVRKVDSSGIVTTVAGTRGSATFAGDGGQATNAALNFPLGVAVDTIGRLWIADTDNYRVRKVDVYGVITTVAGLSGCCYSGDGGPATSAQLSEVSGVALDTAGNLFIADGGNARVRKISTAGVIATVAGNGIMGGSGDNGPATSAELFYPSSVAVDSNGNLYIGDSNSGTVRKVATSGNIGTSITAAVAGNGISSIAVDAAGNLYVTDSQRVRKLAKDGTVTTVAGTGTAGYSGDGGPATQAQLSNPQGTVMDSYGNLYIVDQKNLRIRVVDPAGNISTVAGNGLWGHSGDGGPATSAELWGPSALALDSAGNLVIADGAYVRKVDKAGIITTIASGLNVAQGIAVGAGGYLYVAESGNDLVRVLVPQVPDLTVAAAHSGSFTQGQSGAVYTITVSNTGAAPTSGTVTVTDSLPGALAATAMSGAGWSCTLATLTCTRSDVLAAGASYQAVSLTVSVAVGAPASVTNTATVSGGGEINTANDTANDATMIAPAPACTYGLSSGAATLPAAGGSVTVTVTAGAGCSWTASSALGWASVTAPVAGSGNGSVSLTVVPNAGSARSGTVTVAGLPFNVQQVAAGTTGAQFIPVAPCRVADTRNSAGLFGGPTMAGGQTRSFAIPSSGCGIPATAQAYSLNVTVVPNGPLGYLSLWPTGQPQPVVSTLNSWGGAVVANAAIVPAGTGGAVSVFVSDSTNVILDINGYFDSTGSAFYPATPCRVADTRNTSGQFGGPSMFGGQTRDFPIPLSPCAIPSTSSAYAMNVTVVPGGALGYLSTWPTGQAQPYVSTLNSWTGKVVANAAIVPAGTNESISVFVSNPTDVILDINGYFAPPGNTGALNFYPVTPCRVADTRNATSPFGGPEMAANSTRSFAIPASGCFVPSTAAAYSVNVTVVPDGALGYLSAWPAGAPQPNVSTLNSWDGSVVANAAIVPAGTSGAISVFATNPTNVILDINGYFAP